VSHELASAAFDNLLPQPARLRCHALTLSENSLPKVYLYEKQIDELAQVMPAKPSDIRIHGKPLAYRASVEMKLTNQIKNGYESTKGKAAA
jgi:hypothetical protein